MKKVKPCYCRCSKTKHVTPHTRMMPAQTLARLPEHPANPEGRALVEDIKARIQAICIENGVSHFQVGKDYPYLDTRTPEVRAFVTALKRQLDPRYLMNPGALGLRGQP